MKIGDECTVSLAVLRLKCGPHMTVIFWSFLMGTLFAVLPLISSLPVLGVPLA